MKRAIGLTFPGRLQDEAVICSICKNFNINLNIIEASFSMSSGWAILELVGEDEEMQRVFEYLQSHGIQVQQIEKKDA
ncbi:MAG: NIL domain-containing protein [Candidatus Omnitrophica bacterium]|nr:NIL domain-containing protein [Candidatus Omnitrophota bacterium]